MRGPMSRRRLVPTTTSPIAASTPASLIESPISDGATDAPGNVVHHDVCFIHVTEDSAYTAALRDTLEAFGISASTENVSMLPAESPRLRDPQQFIVRRHRLTVLLVSDAYELYHVLNGSSSQAFASGLGSRSDCCLMAVLDEVHIAELAPLRASAVLNLRREPSELLVAIKKRLDALDVSPQQPGHQSAESCRERTGVGDASDDLAQLVKYKPNGWRTTLQAAVMVDELQKLEGKQRDHEVGRAIPGLTFSRYEASNFLQEMVVPDLERFLRRFSDQLSLIKSNEYTEDASRVERAARELVGISEELLDWSARVRGAQTPPSWVNMVHCAAALSNSMLASVSDFVTAYSLEACRLREEVGYDGTGASVVLTFDLDSALLDRLLQEYQKVHRG